MTRNSLKSTTAILAAISLLQPVPSLAQANANTADAETHAETVDDEGALAAAVTVAENLVDDAAAQIEAEAEAEAQAEVDAAAADQTEAEAEAEALAAEEAEAEADAAAADQAEAEAKAAAEAHAEAEAEAEALAAEEAEAKADAAAADKAEEDAAAAADARAEAEAEAEALAAEEAEALAAEVDDETPADVTTETITEDTSRSSDEEFDEWNPENQQDTLTQQNAAPQAKSDSGMSDLQKAGLLALGAAVVGGILLNGQRVEANTGDRVIVVDDDNDYRILKDDDALLRQPGSDVRTQRFSDGSTRTNVMRSDGTEIVTIRDSRGRVLRRVLIETDGREYVLFDDTQEFAPVVVRDLPEPKVDTYDYQAASDRESLRAALLAADQRDIGRSFSLQQVREIYEVRKLSPEINLQNVTFATASAAIQPSQAEQLRQMGLLMRDIIAEDPTEVFLIEGYTDAIGEPGYNLLLSDRRAESVALAFNEYFDVPTENMVVQGYGERFLKIPTQQAERVNRRVAVRRITTLMRDSGR
ncbi:hypothetical protein C6W92_04445 [Roseovarius sp. A46]|uniref:OmpA family protein n=1 Tax=Roseovarius sp. A46 TaxID=2109331 RepID=UPI001013477A|nr:OmpA family protein [Roseovarius sp. A46]RXV66419.1 hypothetical protein C6W92_04445 [Roseovarius sp. A46]